MKIDERFGDGESLVAPKSSRIFEDVIEYFRGQIAQGKLRPGDRLLPERELCERLGVSRHSLREALRSLEMLGMIDVRRGQGAFVSTPDANAVASFLGISLSLQPSAFESVTEARMAIECQAIRLACKRADASDLALIHEALQEIPQELGNTDRGGDADYRFHTMIVKASHSEVLLFLYQALESLLKRSHHQRRAAIFNMPDFLSTLGEAHDRLYEAIVSRDENRAEEEMRRHFFLVQRYYAELEGNQ